MKVEESKRFLRFVTGSSVVTVDSMKVSFNALSGLALVQAFCDFTLNKLQQNLS